MASGRNRRGCGYSRRNITRRSFESWNFRPRCKLVFNDSCFRVVFCIETSQRETKKSLISDHLRENFKPIEEVVLKAVDHLLRSVWLAHEWMHDLPHVLCLRLKQLQFITQSCQTEHQQELLAAEPFLVKYQVPKHEDQLFSLNSIQKSVTCQRLKHNMKADILSVLEFVGCSPEYCLYAEPELALQQIRVDLLLKAATKLLNPLLEFLGVWQVHRWARFDVLLQKQLQGRQPVPACGWRIDSDGNILQ